MIRRPPGPKPHLVIGNMPLAGRAPLPTFLRWARQFGDIFYYRALWLHVYFLNHPDLIEAVLIGNARSVQKDHVVRNSRWFLGEGLLTSEGESWLRQRRLLQPAFHRARIASYAKIMVDLTEHMLSGWRAGEVRDIHADMMQLTLRIVVRCLFPVEAGEIEKIPSAMNALMRNASGVRMLFPPVTRYLPIPTMIAVREAVRHLDETVYRIIAERRASPDCAGDLLSTLVRARDEDGSRLTDRQLRDEIMTFLLAGHETTALALSWTWHLLAEHRAVEEKLHRELGRVLGNRAAGSADVPALTYSERVIKESMRLYPPAWSLARTVTADLYMGGYRIPAGANVVMSQWIMHRHPRYFPEPETFDPDRWLPQQAEKLPRFAYFPFGGGGRQCIGASFAMMEAVLVLVTIARRFRLRSVPGETVVPVPGFTLRPKHGIPMRLEAEPAEELGNLHSLAAENLSEQL
ncbi:MAG: cytochrome P450 [Acidobacteria bacterium]|nr:cytochrome P450 [Acidobacteriota bacterium]